jgi:hypothetical protein
MHYLDRVRYSCFETLGKLDDFGKRLFFVRCRDDYVITKTVFPNTSPIESLFLHFGVNTHCTEKLNPSCKQVA